MISKFFIERPVLANVLAILMILIGAVALYGLPIAQYPDVVPPTVQVTTRYPGASARTVMDTVALPIEQQVNGVENMIYMQSTSASDGSYTLTVTFKIGTDLDAAQILVQNRVASALSSLPQAVQAQGVTVQKRSTAILLFVTLTSPNDSYDSLYLANYATINLRDELSRLPGVGNVNVFGAGQYSMRVWLDPEKLKARSLNAQDVVTALQQQSQDVTAGQVGMPPTPPGVDFQYTIELQGRLSDVEQFENVIVKTGNNGEVTRLRDVGRVELGAQTYSQILQPRRQAGRRHRHLPVARRQCARGRASGQSQNGGAGAAISRRASSTRSRSIPRVFVNASIHEVYKTLIEAAVLVLIVILVFLQDWRAMLVPATTVPVTIVGAFAMMWALGFTVNFSTLFAIVLSIGIVVDDAIVVVEGAAHNIEKGMSGHDAAIKAMNELFGPIIGITLVLMSVFLPAAFLPGLTGRMYAQFALVIAATALLSAVNAVTLKPTQSAMWLRPPVPPERRNAFYRGFNAVYGRLERNYAGLIHRMVDACRDDDDRRLRDHRACGLGPVAGADRLPADRGSGLSAGQRAASRRRVAGAHPAGAASRSPRSRARMPSVAQVDRHRRHLGARQQRDARQCRRRLCGAQGLERARRSAHAVSPAVAALDAVDAPRHGAAAAADPGHRQCRRFHHADRIARRQHRFCQAAKHHQYHRRQCAVAERAATRVDVVPRRGAADPGRGRSRQGADFARSGRSGVFDAGDLFRLDLRVAVQQIRPRVPGLCAGRCEIPAAAARHRQSLGAQCSRAT